VSHARWHAAGGGRLSTGQVGQVSRTLRLGLHNKDIQAPTSRTYCRRSRLTRRSGSPIEAGDTRRFIATATYT